MAASRAGRVVALDPGAVRIGVAVSDSARTLAFPRPAVAAGEQALAKLLSVIEEEMATAVVVGHALSLSGESGTAADHGAALAEALTASLAGRNIDVCLVDERFTTATAQAKLRAGGTTAKAQRQVIDSAAAAVLLQAFLDGAPK